MEDNKALREFLKFETDIIPLVVDRGDGTYAAIYRYMFTTAIISGRNDDWMTISNRWCYHDTITALIRLGEWKANDYKGEPQGWHRHPQESTSS